MKTDQGFQASLRDLRATVSDCKNLFKRIFDKLKDKQGYEDVKIHKESYLEEASEEVIEEAIDKGVRSIIDDDEIFKVAAAETIPVYDKANLNSLQMSDQRDDVTVTFGQPAECYYFDHRTVQVATGNQVKQVCTKHVQQKKKFKKAKVIMDGDGEDNNKEKHDVKRNDLENCAQELKQKSNAVGAIEVSAVELKQTRTENSNEFDYFLLKLQQKLTARDTYENSDLEMKHLLAEKFCQLDTCLLELRQKPDALDNYETNFGELERSLSGKNAELKMCLLELLQKFNALEATEVSVEERMVSQKTIEEVYKFFEKIIMIIWSWYYKDKVVEKKMEHPSKWIKDWKIAWILEDKDLLKGGVMIRSYNRG